MQRKYNSVTEENIETLVPSLNSEWGCAAKNILIRSLPLCGFEDQIYTIIMLETTTQWLYNLNGSVWSLPKNLTNRNKNIFREKYVEKFNDFY